MEQVVLHVQLVVIVEEEHMNLIQQQHNELQLVQTDIQVQQVQQLKHHVISLLLDETI
jgi:hypothetical protein